MKTKIFSLLLSLLFIIISLKMNKLYAIEEDEQGYHVVKRYKVTWKNQN
jgi:hypothetical protein